MAPSTSTRTAISSTPPPAPAVLSLEAIDRMFDQRAQPNAIYQELKRIQQRSSGANSIAVLWRLARACLLRAMDMPFRSTEQWQARLTVLDEGLSYTDAALRINKRDFNSLRYACMLLGRKFDDRMGARQKVELGLKLHKKLQKAEKLNPSHHEILHMQGRLIYSVARLSKIERMAASTWSPGMSKLIKSASYSAAIEKFEMCERTTRGQSIDNLFFLAKCYQKNGDVANAVRRFTQLIGVGPANLVERQLIEEARQQLREMGHKTAAADGRPALIQ